MSAFSPAQIKAAYEKAHTSPAYNIVLAMYRAADQGAWAADLTKGEQVTAIARISAYIQEKGKMGAGEASKLAGDVWEGMPVGERRQLIEYQRGGAAVTQMDAIIAAAVMKHEAAANSINPGGAQDVKLASTGKDEPFYDALGRNRFDRSYGFLTAGSSIYNAALRGEKVDSTDLGSIKDAYAYSMSAYASTGLSYQQFVALKPQIAALQSMGFAPQNIATAIKDSGSLGIDPKTNLAFLKAAAKVDELDPARHDARIKLAKDMQGKIENNPSLKSLHEQQMEALARGDHEGARRIQKQMEEQARAIARNATGDFSNGAPNDAARKANTDYFDAAADATVDANRRIDADVKAGRKTKAEGERLKKAAKDAALGTHNTVAIDAGNQEAKLSAVPGATLPVRVAKIAEIESGTVKPKGDVAAQNDFASVFDGGEETPLPADKVEAALKLPEPKDGAGDVNAKLPKDGDAKKAPPVLKADAGANAEPVPDSAAKPDVPVVQAKLEDPKKKIVIGPGGMGVKV